MLTARAFFILAKGRLGLATRPCHRNLCGPRFLVTSSRVPPEGGASFWNHFFFPWAIAASGAATGATSSWRCPVRLAWPRNNM